MANPAGESKDEILKLDFDRRLMLQFRGSVVTSDAGLLALSRTRVRPNASENEQICPTIPFRLREVSIAVRTLLLSCRKAGKAPIFTPVRESSGESRLIVSGGRELHYGRSLIRQCLSAHRTLIYRTPRQFAMALFLL